MDRNSVIGLILIGIILVSYSIFFAPEPDPQLASTPLAKDLAADSAATTANDPANISVDSLVASGNIAEEDSAFAAYERLAREKEFGPFASSFENQEKSILVETEKFKAELSSKGGRIASVVLKEYVTYDSLPLILWDERYSEFSLELPFRNKTIKTSDFNFSVSGNDLQLSGDESSIITCRIGNDSQYLEYVYTFKGNSYDIGLKINAYGLNNDIPNASGTRLIMAQKGLPLEKSLEVERNNSAVFFKPTDDGRDYLSETSDDEETLDSDRLDWVAFKQNFFSVIAIGEQPFGAGAILKSAPEEDPNFTEDYYASLPVEFGNMDLSSVGMKLYFGPNKYKILKTYGNEMDKIISLGWGIFGWVNKFLVIPIFDFFSKFDFGYGLIILLLTIVIKIIVFPLTYKNYLSSAKMKVLKPEIDELNEKYKNADPMKKQQATLELYRQTGVNPFAGCIPLLIQMPILYAMFRFFPASIELRQESFLWAEDLSSYDSIASLPFYIPAYGDHVSLWTILMCASTFAYTMYNTNQMPTQTQPGMPNMKVLMYIFPFMMLFIFNSFASGLSYYYFLANVISIIQMLVIKNFIIDEDKIHAKIASNKARPVSEKKSGFQKRLEEMARQRSNNPKK